MGKIKLKKALLLFFALIMILDLPFFKASNVEAMVQRTSATHTYYFYDTENNSTDYYARQIVRPGESVLRPADPRPQNDKIFFGWYVKKIVKNGESILATDEKAKTDPLFKQLKEKESTITGDGSLRGFSLPFQDNLFSDDEKNANNDIEIHLVPKFTDRLIINYIAENQLWRVDGLTLKNTDTSSPDALTMPSPHIRTGGHYFAYWMKKDDYDRIKETNGGKPVEEDTEDPQGDTLPNGKKAPYRKRYEFTREKLKDHLNEANKYLKGGPAPKNGESLDLVAVEGLKNEIFFNSQGGTPYPPLYVRYNQSLREGGRQYFDDGKTFDQMPETTRTGYNFVGWSTEKNLMVKAERDLEEAKKDPKLKLWNVDKKVEKPMSLYAVWQPTKAKYSISVWLEDPDQVLDEARKIGKVNHLNTSYTLYTLQKEDKDLTYSKYKFFDAETKGLPEVISGEKIDFESLRKFFLKNGIYNVDLKDLLKDGESGKDEILKAYEISKKETHKHSNALTGEDGRNGLYEPVKGDGTTVLKIYLRRKQQDYTVHYQRYQSDKNNRKLSFPSNKGDPCLYYKVPFGYLDAAWIKDIKNRLMKDREKWFRGFADDEPTNFPITDQKKWQEGAKEVKFHEFYRTRYRDDINNPYSDNKKSRYDDFTQVYKDLKLFAFPKKNKSMSLGICYVEWNGEGKIQVEENGKTITINNHPSLKDLARYAAGQDNIAPSFVKEVEHSKWVASDISTQIPGFSIKSTIPKRRDYGIRKVLVGDKEDMDIGYHGRINFRTMQLDGIGPIVTNDKVTGKPIVWSFAYYTRNTYDITVVPNIGLSSKDKDFEKDRSGNFKQKFDYPIKDGVNTEDQTKKVSDFLNKFKPRRIYADGSIDEGTTVVKNGVTLEFMGWSWTEKPLEESKVNLTNLGNTPSRNTVIFGIWKPKDVTLTVHKDDEVDGPTYKIVLPYNTPAKLGDGKDEVHHDGDLDGKPGGDPYGASEFKWWFWVPRSKDGYEEPYVFDSKITEDRTIFPRWLYRNVKVNYDINGGSGVAPIDNIHYAFKSHASLKPRGVRINGRYVGIKPPDGKVFVGWSKDKNPREDSIIYQENSLLKLDKKLMGDQKPIESPEDPDGRYEVTLYAIYADKPKTTEITYHQNGYEGGNKRYSMDKDENGEGLPVNIRHSLLAFEDPKLGFNKTSKKSYFNLWSTKAKGALNEGRVFHPKSIAMLNNDTKETPEGEKGANHLYARYSNIELIKTVDKPYYLKVGDILKYQVTVKNTGNIDWPDVALKDSLLERSEHAQKTLKLKQDPEKDFSDFKYEKSGNKEDGFWLKTPGILKKGDSWTWTYEYKISEEDLVLKEGEFEERVKNTARIKVDDPAVPEYVDDNGTNTRGFVTEEITCESKLRTFIEVKKDWEGTKFRPDSISFAIYRKIGNGNFEKVKMKNGQDLVKTFTGDEAKRDSFSFDYKDLIPEGLPYRDGSNSDTNSNRITYQVREVRQAGISPEYQVIGPDEAIEGEEVRQDRAWRFKITNRKVRLPETGFRKKNLYRLIGFLLIGLGIGLYSIKKSKRRKGGRKWKKH